MSSGGPSVATVRVTVDDAKPGYEGLYFWNYRVTNDNFQSYEGRNLGAFSITAGDPADVSNLGSSLGWGGSVGTFMGRPDQVFWQAGGSGGIGRGASADFWFTTPITAVELKPGLVANPMLTAQAGGAVAAPAPAIVVTTHLDNMNGDTETSLREAIDEVNHLSKLAGFWKVKFAANLNGATITLDPNRGQLELQRDIYIDGQGRNVTVQRDPVQGDPDNAIKHRIFEVAGPVATIAGLTIKNGESTGNGGAILSRGDLTLKGCVLQNNFARDRGGAIATTKQDLAGGGSRMGNLVIENSTISGNEAAIGGGIYVTDGNLTMSSSYVNCNSAYFGGGGGIMIEQTEFDHPNDLPTVSLTGTEVYGNSTNFSPGGGISCEGHLSLNAGTVISTNTVNGGVGGPTQGGGVYLAKGSLSASGNPTIGFNEATQGDGIYIVEDAVRNPGAITFQGGDTVFDENPA